jgi:hypothetical protein
MARSQTPAECELQTGKILHVTYTPSADTHLNEMRVAVARLK